MDFDTEEISSLENIFPHIRVFLCYFHREQSWHRFYINSSTYSFLKTRYLFKQNKSLKCKGYLQEISFRAKWNIFNSVYGQFLIAACWKYPEMKIIAGYFDRNENSIFKWNPPKRIYTCKFFIKSKTVHQKSKNKKKKKVSFHFSRNEN